MPRSSTEVGPGERGVRRVRLDGGAQSPRASPRRGLHSVNCWQRPVLAASMPMPTDTSTRIREGAARMQSLLADVVDYWAAAAAARGCPPARTWKRSFARRSSCTDQQIAERSAVVTHDPLPAVCGDFEILAKVLHHLIRNAIEYCDTPAPRVHISSRRVDLDWVFSVQDNGPGIEPAFQGRIFERVQAPARKGTPRERTRTRILQEGDRGAWRSNVDGVDARGGIDILLHSAPCRSGHKLYLSRAGAGLSVRLLRCGVGGHARAGFGHRTLGQSVG